MPLLSKDKVKFLKKYLHEKGFDLETITHQEIKSGNFLLTRRAYRRLAKWIKNISYHDLIHPDTPLPDKANIQFDRVVEKLRHLHTFLKDNKGVELSRAISVSERQMDHILTGFTYPNIRIIKKIAVYFFLDVKTLRDDQEELPSDDKLQVDEDLVSIQRDDDLHTMLRNKNKHTISRNYRVLGHKSRVSLWTSLLGLIIPLLAYTGLCAYSCLYDRIDTLQEYRQDGLSQSQQEIEQEINSNLSFDPCEVRIGSQLESISAISPSTSSYQAHLSLWFDFDQTSYFKMVYRKLYGQEIDLSHLSAEDLLRDEITYHTVRGDFTRGPDQIPDWMQVEDLSVTDLSSMELNNLYLEVTSQYPGETSSNNYPDKETMFDIGNGSFIADSFSYEKSFQPYVREKTKVVEDDDGVSVGTKEYRFFQSMNFDITIHKGFDNARYPLDSAQFHIYIRPRQLSTDYVRYVPTELINLTADQSDVTGYTCSIDEQIYASGFSSNFFMGNGYKPLDPDSGYRNIVHRVHYYTDNDQTGVYSTEYEILVRANHEGITLFLQAFINLFAVVVWITIAFYNQSYNGEDSIGMIGTGFFGAISSMLIGLNMISDAGIFSMITMINIFTLAVIMIMAYQSVMSKRAVVKQDKVAIAYNGIKLRILFTVLTICTVIMFIGLPLAAYIWIF